MKRYKHIIFDIDGTLLDTEEAILRSLQDTLSDMLGEEVPRKELTFALGIPGEAALQTLGITDTKRANAQWNLHLRKYKQLIRLFDGVPELLKRLKEAGCSLGIVTSKDRKEYATDFLPFGIGGYFDVTICVEDAPRPKPSPDPLLAYLSQAVAKAENTLYIGDTNYDRLCAEQAGVDFGYALWGNPRTNVIPAKYTFSEPLEILKLKQ